VLFDEESVRTVKGDRDRVCVSSLSTPSLSYQLFYVMMQLDSVLTGGVVVPVRVSMNIHTNYPEFDLHVRRGGGSWPRTSAVSFFLASLATSRLSGRTPLCSRSGHRRTVSAIPGSSVGSAAFGEDAICHIYIVIYLMDIIVRQHIYKRRLRAQRLETQYTTTDRNIHLSGHNI
jgi:hypothetical protein